jgi:hypothetical protein
LTPSAAPKELKRDKRKVKFARQKNGAAMSAEKKCQSRNENEVTRAQAPRVLAGCSSGSFGSCSMMSLNALDSA